jgi:hypothetical protein
VLAAARAWAERPWYSRAWLTWPVGWQAASVAAFALLVAFGAWLAPLAGTSVSEVMAAVPRERVEPLVHGVARIESVARTASAIADAVWLAWRSVMLPGVLYGFVLLGLMCAACAAFSMMASRAVLRQEP